MNKDRLDTVNLAAAVLGALPTGKKVPRISKAITTGLQAILNSEQRAMRAMEPYLDQPGSTPINYDRAKRAATRLQAAITHVDSGAYGKAADELSEIVS
jgi:type II secretory pathway component PulK